MTHLTTQHERDYALALAQKHIHPRATLDAEREVFLVSWNDPRPTGSGTFEAGYVAEDCGKIILVDKQGDNDRIAVTVEENA